MTSPFHDGERAVQQRLGVAEHMAQVGARVVRNHMPDQHREFFAQLPWLLLGSVDAAGQPWASVLTGPAGFIQSPDPRVLQVQAQPVPGDPLAQGLHPGASLGGLGIELHTRRRNRVNGLLRAWDETGLTIDVTQSVGNCPRYITARDWTPQPDDAHPPAAAQALSTLGAQDRARIQQADTLFIASHAAGAGADVSHRGGQPGFAAVLDDGSVLVPDFNGNRMFMTWGNLVSDPRAGLLFPDFASGDVLSLTGRVELLWGPQDWPALAHFEGAERAWRFHPEAGWRLARALPGLAAGGEASPHALATGCWPG